ncbi:MAG: hypothetical protein UIB31_08815 [Methanobrevibacter sp.]|nr:hypothetical protein [Methanobrevibacter sp.]
MPTCPKCGKKTDGKTCPNCKSKLKPKFPIGLVFIVLILVIILLACVFISPYKHIDSADMLNPTIGEKVQFDGEYLGITARGGSDDILYYMPPPIYDVVKYGEQYIFLTGDYNSHNLIGNEGRTVHIEGEFEDSIMTSQTIENGTVNGYFFNADKIELI